MARMMILPFGLAAHSVGSMEAAQADNPDDWLQCGQDLVHAGVAENVVLSAMGSSVRFAEVHANPQIRKG
jgi:hypothetical protein